jgi:plasmid stabilization system protein ParE
MDCTVIYSEAALADLQQITAFIAADNAETAERFANRLVDLAESLRSLPQRTNSERLAGRSRRYFGPIPNFLSLRKSREQSAGIAFLAWGKGSA